MPIIDKFKAELRSLVSISMGEEITSINTKLDSVITENNKLTNKINKIENDELEIFQRLSELEGRFDNLASETWLKVENQILKTNLKKTTGIKPDKLV